MSEIECCRAQLDAERAARREAEQRAAARERELVQARDAAEEATAKLQGTLDAAMQLADEANAAHRAKSEFLAIVSHELRTPLNGVLGFLHLLLASELNEEQRDWVQTIQASSEALLTILNDILDFSRLEADRMAVERVPLSLESCGRDVVNLLKPEARGRGLDLSIECTASEGCRVLGDPGRVRQVLLNLIGNALKFTERGSVYVLVEPAPDGGQGQARVSIIDTGIGIPAEKQVLLFEKFTQADSTATRRFGGTGLGLAISKRLVELMGGRIGFRSEVGRGSTFWFSLPPVPQGESGLTHPFQGKTDMIPDPSAGVPHRAP
ncbi:MAG TPA: ATP-binding protein [Methylomirabilota bacterium]|nr:ATP-binding protein [Methylomirabilota bacterium]